VSGNDKRARLLNAALNTPILVTLPLSSQR